MVNPAAIQAVVFDLDDTLYPERDYVRSGYRAVARRLGGPGTDAKVLETYLWDRFLAGQSARAFDAASEHFGLNLSTEQIAELVEVYRNHRPDIRPYEGIADFLGRLREHCRLGLLSDGFLPAQELKLEALKLGRFFDEVLFTERLGREAWKPSTAGFEAIRRKLALPHEAFAYVADNPAKDFVAANALGWRGIQYLRPGQIHSHNPGPPGGQPQAIVRDLGDLRAAFR
jgi:putative hydrolase of the HAD superfamily